MLASGVVATARDVAVGVTSSILAGLLTLAATLIYQHTRQTDIVLEAPSGNDSVGSHPVISGRVENLKPGYVLWSYNEPLGSSTAYPDGGPCRIQRGAFNCFLTNLTLDPEHVKQGGQAFTLWVAVVDTAQAALNTERKERLNNQSAFENIDQQYGPKHYEDDVRSVLVNCAVGTGCTEVNPG